MSEINKDSLLALIETMGGTSSDPSRHRLGYVQIRRLNDTQVRFDATTGHALSQQIVYDPTFATLMQNIGADRLYLHRDSLPGLKLIAKEFRSQTIKSESDFTGIILGASIRVKLDMDESIKSMFPDVDAVVPKNIPEDAYRFGVDPEKLLQLVNSLGFKRLKTNGIELQQADPKSPIIVKVGSQQGVLMPYRISP